MTYPTSTYRLQFRDGMTFRRAAGLAPYLKTLGISHLYASPIFAVTKGSTHGYDIVDNNRFDPEIGDHADFDTLSDVLREHGIGLILDIVPNHMAASLENPWWNSVVEWGEASRYAHHFDIDWSRRLTLPWLPEPIDAVIDEGSLTLVADRARGNLAFSLSGLNIPVNPSTYAAILPGDDPMFLALGDAAASASPSGEDTFHAAVRHLFNDATGTAKLDALLATLSQDRATIKWLHDRQSWRLIHWRDAPRELSYRRFFEVTELVGVNVEDPRVFKDSHRLIIDLVKTGRVAGLRVDHVDGLSDPGAYLARLRQAVGDNTYLTVEKILEDGEQLPADWPVSGTTGYEFIAALSNLFVDATGAETLRDHYTSLGAPDAHYDQALRDAKQLMATRNFEGEVATLNHLVRQIATADTAPAPTDDAITSAMRALLVAFPVYRTYGTAAGLRPDDRELLGTIIAGITGDLSTTEKQALDLIKRALEGDVAEDRRGKAALFRRRFQQITGPLMAKSLEDTLFYRHMPLLAINEVGADPSRDDFAPEHFHLVMAERAERWPLALSATATHDTKRGEDTRARLYAISEAPDAWNDSITRWRSMNQHLVAALPEGPAPEPEVEWALLQAIAGAWPPELKPDDQPGLAALVDRLSPYAEKALREAKLRSNWTDVGEPYENAVKAYIRALLSIDNSDFLEDFHRTLRPFIHAGSLNSLAQTLIKLTAPGIPDIYQGSERLDLSLVDPDNRRMPDFAALSDMLADDALPDDAELLSGRLKQMIIRHGLGVRRKDPALFEKGIYRPLPASGPLRDHVVAFSRELGDRVVIMVAPRMTMALLDDERPFIPAARWHDTVVALPPSPRDFVDQLSGRHFAKGVPLRLADLLETYPVALLSNA